MLTMSSVESYMAPETVSSARGYDFSADIFSLGCVLVELATGKVPYSNIPNGQQVMLHV